jgi:hypothetical protein
MGINWFDWWFVVSLEGRLLIKGLLLKDKEKGGIPQHGCSYLMERERKKKHKKKKKRC